MHDAHRRSAGRHLLDGGYTVLLVAIAITTGYGVLSSSTWRARPMPSVTVGTLVVVPAADTLPAPVAAEAAAAELEIVQPLESLDPGDAPAAAARLAPSAPPPALEPRVATPEPPPPFPWPSPTVTGRVLDADGNALPGASVVVRGIEVRTDAEGSFTVERVPPEASLIVKMPGFERVRVPPTKGRVDVALRPQAIKAAYLTYYGIGDRGIRNRVLELADRTELNAVVIDVKGDRGWILYKTGIAQALAAGAQGPATLRDFDALMADLKARGIYTIARIVVFKDNVLATARPDLAIIDARTGKPWVDREKLAWLDPFREEVWDYNIAIAREAVQRGFDEVQFDYVRFPTDGKLSVARYSRPNNRQTRLPAITAFLAKARREIGASGAFLAADLFGYTAFNENDTDIGQRIEELAPHLDYICPMVYPSGYHKGIPGHPNPVLVPGKVVHESVRLIRKRAEGTVAQVRPWLQDFRDYAFGRRIFGTVEVQAQIHGSEEAGGSGWMLWNPRNRYTGAALRAEDALAAR